MSATGSPARDALARLEGLLRDHAVRVAASRRARRRDAAVAAVAGGVIVLAAVGLGALLAADRGPVPAASSVFATAEDVRALRGRLDALIAVQAAPALQRATAVEPGAGREEGPAAVRDRGAEAARDDHAPPATSLAHTLEGHRMVATSCDEPTGARRVEIRVGSR